ncbi:MAG: CPBP family intramembrane metalloprotease [Clostridiaceae bacterium]|nr:CPBP family intramembrane metalloprotease [Clostridiaceae bacterium]MBW4861151.1 CPBP family intramembrane metalloprotease [Clostridiaceae bacterium]MBW4869895.1 CPBP family intramembrane metalloprotease [Clostridiaceae bacterium]
MIVLGALIGCIGEEIGWHGFMQPSFNRKYSLFSSAVFTGILWGAWHFGKLVSYGILGYLLFILLITEFSVMMAWIYSKSNRNMICMALFHLGINISSILLLTGREGIMFYTVACSISTLICLVLLLADREKFSTKLSSCEL